MADLDFTEKVLIASEYVASNGPTEHPDPRMHWKLGDMRLIREVKQTTPPDLICKATKQA